MRKTLIIAAAILLAAAISACGAVQTEGTGKEVLQLYGLPSDGLAHEPYGWDNLYGSKEVPEKWWQRSPRDPKAGEEVEINVSVGTSLKDKDIWLEWSLNGELMEPVKCSHRANVSVDGVERLRCIGELGSFNTGDRVEYTVCAGTNGEAEKQLGIFEFSISEWQTFIPESICADESGLVISGSAGGVEATARAELSDGVLSLTVEDERKAFDYALIIIHGTPGEDGKLQGYLDMMGVPYSSCSMTSSVITFDKITTKRTLAGRVNLAREVFLRRGEAFDPAQIVAELGMPLFVKPNANGSSFGVTKVHAPEELPAAIEAAFAQGDEILIEECVTGREMGCGMLVAGGREYVFPITEIVSKKDFFDYEAKYTAGFSDEITPADITPEVKAELNRMTREAYRTCRCSGVVRVDFIVTPAGVPYFIELNSIPGMSGGSIVPKQACEMGMSLGKLYDIIIADTCRK